MVGKRCASTQGGGFAITIAYTACCATAPGLRRAKRLSTSPCATCLCMRHIRVFSFEELLLARRAVSEHPNIPVKFESQRLYPIAPAYSKLRLMRRKPL
jgi:hypothetical protein